MQAFTQIGTLGFKLPVCGVRGLLVRSKPPRLAPHLICVCLRRSGDYLVPSSRIPSLDGLRALSISLVLFAHLAFSAGFPIRHTWWTNLYAHYGVRIFFVLSGFLITTLLRREQEETGTIRLKQFYIRRAYRLLPAAYVYLIAVTVIFHQTLPYRYLVAAYLYLTSYALHSPWPLMHLWSLSVEEQFYLVWPAALAIGLIAARRFAFGAIAVALVARFVFLQGVWPQGAVWSFPAVADSLAAGCLLALYQCKLAKYRSVFTWRGFPLVWAITFSIPVVHHYHYLVHFWHMSGLLEISAIPLFNLGMVLCIQNVITVPPRLLNNAVMIWIGNLSYSLYLWDMPFTDPSMHSWATTFPQNLVLTLIVATISFYAVEQPFRKLGERKARLATPRAARVSYGPLPRFT
jgi:peptidoglycan/LPS O-acetylase OafA/YrhL